jgi:hypothetical protein
MNSDQSPTEEIFGINMALKDRTALVVGYLVIWLHANFVQVKIFPVLVIVWKPVRV